MRALTIFGLVISIPALCSGCGTLCNTVWWAPDEGGGRVYGGTRANIEQIGNWEAWHGKQEAPERFRMGLFTAFDLPLSLIGDTLMLPVNMVQSAQNPRQERSKVAADE